MKKFKKALLSILSLVLVAVLSIGGTLAYLKSEDSDVNVMTMGNVKIAQHEYERATNEDGSYQIKTVDNQTSYVLKEFTQDKPLYPAVADPNTYPSGYDSIPVRMSQVKSYGGMSVFNEPNAQDKFVTVENTGRSDAYVRTLIAIEIGEGNSDLIGINLHTGAWDIEGIGEIEVDNNKYYLFEFVYAGAQLSNGSWRHENGVLPAKDTTYPSLSQVYLKTEATNEDCEALDGNGNGRLDILVLSQATQTKGFADAKTALDAAFGKTNANNAPAWFTNMKKEVSEISGKYTIRQNTTINLEANQETTFVENIRKNVTINGNGNTLTSGDSSNYGVIASGGETVINELDVDSLDGGVGATNGAKVELNNVDIDVTSASTSARYNIYAVGEGTKVTVNGGTYSFSPTLNQKRAYIYVGSGATVYVKAGTFGKASARSGYRSSCGGSHRPRRRRSPSLP